MSDLSRLLDDVYGDTGTGSEPAASEPGTGATSTLNGLPDWAVDSVLDEAFADWVPGPPTPAAGEPTRPLAAGRSALSELAAPVPAAAEPEEARAWSRDEDDILPTRRGRRGRAVAPPAAAAPSIESFAADDEPVAPARGRRLGRRRG